MRASQKVTVMEPFNVEDDTTLRESLRGTFPRQRPPSPARSRPASSTRPSRPVSARLSPARRLDPARDFDSRSGIEEAQTLSSAFSKTSHRGIRSLPTQIKPAFRSGEKGALVRGVRALEADVHRDHVQLAPAVSIARGRAPSVLTVASPAKESSADHIGLGSPRRSAHPLALDPPPSGAPVPHALASAHPFVTGGAAEGPSHEVKEAAGQEHPGRLAPQKSFSRFDHQHSAFGIERQLEYQHREAEKRRWVSKKGFVTRSLVRPLSAYDTAGRVRYLPDPFNFSDELRRKERAESRRKTAALHRHGGAFYAGAKRTLSRPTLQNFVAGGLEAFSRDLALAHPAYFRGIDVDSHGLIVLRYKLEDPASEDGTPAASPRAADAPAAPPLEPSTSPRTSPARTRPPAPPSPRGLEAPDPALAAFFDDPETHLLSYDTLPPPLVDLASRLKREVTALALAHPAAATHTLRRDALHWGVPRRRGAEGDVDLLFALHGPFTKVQGRVPERLQRPPQGSERLPWPAPQDLSARDRPAGLVHALREVQESKPVPVPPIVSPTLLKYRPPAPVTKAVPLNAAPNVSGSQAQASQGRVTGVGGAERILDVFQSSMLSALSSSDGFMTRDGFVLKDGRTSEYQGPEGDSALVFKAKRTAGPGPGQPETAALNLRSSSPLGPGAAAHPSISSALAFVPFTKIPMAVAQSHARTLSRTTAARVPYGPTGHYSFVRPAEATMRYGGPITARDVSAAALLREARLVQQYQAEFHT